jgi:hypothetical protein
MDVIAMAASRRAVRTAQHDLGVVIEDELNFRRPGISNYLFKSPVFDITLHPVFEKFISSTGWIGAPINYWFKYMMLMQQYFYYTEN